MPYYINYQTTSEPDDALPITNARYWFGYGPVSDVGCNQGDWNVIMTVNKLSLKPILRSLEYQPRK
jgi:hypothetical protein